MAYHDIRDEGRLPGRRPPTAALVPWVGTKLGIPPGEREGVAYVVARAIGARGYEGAHMVDSGWNRTKRKTRPLLQKAGLRIVRSMR